MTLPFGLKHLDLPFGLKHSELLRIILDGTGCTVGVLISIGVVPGGTVLGGGLFCTALSNLWHQFGHANAYARAVNAESTRKVRTAAISLWNWFGHARKSWTAHKTEPQ